MTIPAAPKISITNTDNRQIQNLRLAVLFVTDGAPHFDFEDQGTFDRVTTDGLDATRPGGTWNGSNWVGNSLYTKGSQSTHAVLAAINQELAKADDSWSDAGDAPILPEITIIRRAAGLNFPAAG